MLNLTYNQEKLKDLCQKYNIDLLILHGSYARGNATPESDIDLGVFGNKNTIKGNYLEVLSALTEVFGDKADPAFLNGTEPMICYQTAIHGRPIYEKQRGDFLRFKLASILRYMDTKKFRDLEKHYLKKAIGENNHD